MAAERLRTARTLVITFENGHVVVRNFLTGRAFECNARWVGALSTFEDWTTREGVADALRGAGFNNPDPTIDQMVGLTALVVEGSDGAHADIEYSEGWQWGAIAGLFHFGAAARTTTPYLDEDDQEAWLGYRAMTAHQPELSTRNASLPVTALPEVERSDFIDLVERRRSRRKFTGAPATPAQLAAVLHSAFRVVDVRARASTHGLPLTTTPSGGARNPFEAYVIVSAVDGMAPGLYHYSGGEHTLGLVRADASPAAEMLGGQTWTRASAFTVLLVAHLERTMWKYVHPSAYRVVLLEAGHIAQNLLLAGTDAGLASTPTAALYSDAVASALDDANLLHAPLHAVVFGLTDPDSSWTDEWDEPS